MPPGFSSILHRDKGEGKGNRLQVRKGSPSSQPLQGTASESHAEISPRGEEEKTTHSVPRQRRCLQPLIIAVCQEGKPDSSCHTPAPIPACSQPSPRRGEGTNKPLAAPRRAEEGC